MLEFYLNMTSKLFSNYTKTPTIRTSFIRIEKSPVRCQEVKKEYSEHQKFYKLNVLLRIYY